MKTVLTLLLVLTAVAVQAQQIVYERVLVHTYEKTLTALKRDTVLVPGEINISGDSVCFVVSIAGDSVQVGSRLQITDGNGFSKNTTWATAEVTPFTSVLNRKAEFGAVFKKNFAWYFGRLRLAVYNGKGSSQKINVKVYISRKRGT